MVKEFNVSLEYYIKKAVKKLREAEERGNHCKTTITIYDYYNSWCIDEIDRYLNAEKVKYNKDESNKQWVIYKLEL
ncbi:MAG: hypothetical protein ACI3T9_03960 [Romboutsia timonensis]